MILNDIIKQKISLKIRYLDKSLNFEVQGRIFGERVGGEGRNFMREGFTISSLNVKGSPLKRQRTYFSKL